MAHFFGFGSLVNVATHNYFETIPARVQGFVRVWINNDCYEHAFLSVVPRSASEIQGLLAKVWNEDWSQLDEREIGYKRVPLNHNEWSLEDQSEIISHRAAAQFNDVQLYQHAYGTLAQSDKPILRSYLETVLYGYYQIFGEKGVRQFVDSTVHWTAIFDDCDAPIYPRYIPPKGSAATVVIPIIEALCSSQA